MTRLNPIILAASIALGILSVVWLVEMVESKQHLNDNKEKTK